MDDELLQRLAALKAQGAATSDGEIRKKVRIPPATALAAAGEPQVQGGEGLAPPQTAGHDLVKRLAALKAQGSLAAITACLPAAALAGSQPTKAGLNWILDTQPTAHRTNSGEKAKADVVALRMQIQQLQTQLVPPPLPARTRSGEEAKVKAAALEAQLQQERQQRVQELAAAARGRQEAAVWLAGAQLFGSALSDVPSTWIAQSSAVEVVPVAASTQEFDVVQRAFFESAGDTGHSIRKIERIQHQDQWQRYSLLRTQWKNSGLPLHPNERVGVWHGTNAAAKHKIIRQGFNRSFNSVAMYGFGVYFARY
jgi:hypothetical protein